MIFEGTEVITTYNNWDGIRIYYKHNCSILESDTHIWDASLRYFYLFLSKKKTMKLTNEERVFQICTFMELKVKLKFANQLPLANFMPSIVLVNLPIQIQKLVFELE